MTGAWRGFYPCPHSLTSHPFQAFRPCRVPVGHPCPLTLPSPPAFLLGLCRGSENSDVFKLKRFLHTIKETRPSAQSLLGEGIHLKSRVPRRDPAGVRHLPEQYKQHRAEPGEQGLKRGSDLSAAHGLAQDGHVHGGDGADLALCTAAARDSGTVGLSSQLSSNARSFLSETVIKNHMQKLQGAGWGEVNKWKKGKKLKFLKKFLKEFLKKS